MHLVVAYLRMMRVLSAYLDPGTGSMIIQALIATAVAVPLFFRHQIARILRFGRRDRDPETPGESPKR